ncbi:endonuclease/exonuclease/phosphatase family protein [Enterococcus cecorum]
MAKVGEIQGHDHLGAFTHQNVTVKDVVVTAVENSSRFYVQDLHPDGDITTSDGMSVYFKNHNVKVGDQLELKGTVAEVFGSGYAEKEQTDLTITQLQATQVTKVGTAQVPAPVVLGVDRKVPSQHIENDGFVNFDPADDALDFWESLEGMLVAVNHAKILVPQKNGELFVLPGESTDILNHSGGLLLDEDFNPQIIALSTGDRKLRAKAKDTIEGQVAGPVTYSYGMYKVYLPKNSVKIKDGKLAREKTTIKASKDKLTIASYNIENFSANKESTSDEKVQRIAQSFVNDLNAPDIITLLEMQDNNGPIDDGNTDATQSAKRLIEAIEKAGGPSYQYIDVAPENNQDGGAPGANIRVGFLYNPKRVDYNTSEAIGKGDELFKDTRKSLAGYFTFNGQKLLLIGNHLNSKRGDQPLYGSHQPASFASAMKRDQLAQTIATYVDKAVKSDPSLKVVMTGDFNDFEFSNTLAILEGKQLVNLVKTHPAEDRYSYFYLGNSETLDHILVSKDLAKNAVFDMIHINAMFMQEDGRASDHDPVMVQLTFKKQKPDAGEKDKDKGDSTDNQDKKNNNGKLPKKLKKDLPAAGTKIMGSLVLIGVVLIGAAIIIRVYNTKKAK